MTRASPTRWCRLLVAVGVACLGAPAARADDYVDQANRLYATVRPEKRSDLILLPVLAKMAPPPAAASTPERAMLVPTGTAAWPAALEWAMAQPQRDALEAMKRAVGEFDPLDPMAFAQPYGVEALGATAEGRAMIAAELYTDLGDPPILAAARFLYLPALERLSCLVHVEATRLTADGLVADAGALLVDWALVARQMADRAFFVEVRWGYRAMTLAIERIRDIAYYDFRYGQGKLTEQEIIKGLERVRDDHNGGRLRLDRLVLPAAERIAGEQVVSMTFLPRNGPDPTAFGATMARLGSTRRPLRLFAEAARWESVSAGHAPIDETLTQLGRVVNDWRSRWPLSPFDRMMALPTDYERMDAARFAVVRAVVQDQGLLFNDRQVLRAQVEGTRCGLGVLAFHLANGRFPPDISSIRPRYVTSMEDPFNPALRDRAGSTPLEYFVPIRDTRPPPGSRDPQPHEINVFTARGESNFKVPVGDDQFVLYSVGPDGAKNWADRVSAAPARDFPGDLLLWPPVISLYRQRLIDTGQMR